MKEKFLPDDAAGCAFLEQLKCAASEADTEGMSLEDALRLTLLSGVRDTRLKEKLSKLETPTLSAKITEAEKKRQVMKRKCFCCGSADHMANN